MRPAMAEKSFEACREVLALQEDYFKDITEHGIGMARQYAFLAEELTNAVFLGDAEVVARLIGQPY